MVVWPTKESKVVVLIKKKRIQSGCIYHLCEENISISREWCSYYCLLVFVMFRTYINQLPLKLLEKICWRIYVPCLSVLGQGLDFFFHI